MSTCAILCPGPSLPKLWRPEYAPAFNTIVAVNTAGHRYMSHWLAFADVHIVQPIRDGQIPPPRVGYICKRGHKTGPGCADISQMFKALGKVPDSMQNELDPKCGFTFANALAWAQFVKYEQITVFGFDCSRGPADFTGQPGDHSAFRWYKELIWIKAAWGPNVIVISDLDPAIREWLDDPHTKDGDLAALLGLDNAAVSA